MRGVGLLVLGVVLLVLALHLHGCSAQGGGADDDGGGGSSGSSAATAPMEEKERRALFAAIESFVGKGWNGSGLYPDPCGWSPIQGVSCDIFNGLWYPTVISIGPVLDNSLQCAPDAKFSPQLFELRHLKSLSFYSCFPASNPTAIPATSWDKLSGSLETLEFRTNPGLAGPIPASLGRLASLQSLVLVENNLTGAVPPELGALGKLRRLVLSGNGLSGPIPATLGALRGLLKLDLSNNRLQGPVPPELAGLRSLTLLDLRNNSLTGGVPQFVTQSSSSMASLQDLLLSNNPLGGSLAQSGWEKLSGLATLDLANVGLVGAIPESMAKLTGLRFLALDHNRLTGKVPAKLAELPNIGAMYLNGNNLTGTLEFSPGFYQRMGRRFASWDNPGLCYNLAAVDAAHAPSGVVVCKDLQEPSVGAKDKAGGRPEASSSLVASSSSSLGLTAAEVNGCWQKLVAASWLVLMLLL
ncbi:hypothetical protein EJB05_31927 [Eragrostis curvula]|uniref:Disease resistance R13L4/SHOC-2-like LRR domain-containing protein n=1 Tax=Eragrostis curvula TaxID=38414 RepID=A0A5J9UEV4_9POAL|nr:hypothetical protein EJB05_31927 [Eragrostis curvula]